ncbi:MAG: exopolysaccharide biosynthesis polyprenyl glycosylphosphotransferase [Candidatus Lloydbacteria bacterium]|nr:exopolysaccharide biosynthesis polyprenyl glycosylphosphotransferase [Candidatus Lloydbacteria bacterium]
MHVMGIENRWEAAILFLGDIVLLYVALWVSLALRYFELPNSEIISLHLIPFSIIFVVWALSFFIAGLYDKHTLFLRKRLPSLVLKTQVWNSVLAVLFFYFIPLFKITPKTSLFIYLGVSFLFILGWRLSVVAFAGPSRREKAILIGTGREMRELEYEVNKNPRYHINFVLVVDVEKVNETDFKNEIINTIYAQGITTIVVDLQNDKVTPLVPHLYNLIFSKMRFVDKYKIYEEVFDREPLSLLGDSWFLENISQAPHLIYDALKRVMDMAVSLVLGVVSLVFYPLVWLIIKLDDGGAVFTYQNRVGQDKKIIRLMKFRTMTANDQGQWSRGVKNEVTRVGKFLRRTRIDELPQLWNVLAGDISLIGPRPEFPEPAEAYAGHIPYYNIRYLIKPGLSGWAQIYQKEAPHHDVDIEQTRRKLSYDLYYIKNRSFLLDIKIALKTIKTLLSRTGI